MDGAVPQPGHDDADRQEHRAEPTTSRSTASACPGFQFIQDEVEYNTLTHHTNMDNYERLQPNDVIRMATIVAGFAYLAANRDEMLPRKPANVPSSGGRRGQ